MTKVLPHLQNYQQFSDTDTITFLHYLQAELIKAKPLI